MDQVRPDSEPYCSNCGYTLTGATESSKCPECGKPLVEVLMRPILEATGGRRFRSKARILGMPVLDIAFGAHGTEKMGRPRGFIAIGDVATGVLAIGGQARGVVAIGGMAMGGFSMGGMSMGLLTSLGGLSIGGVCFGGFAIGLLARGGGAIGILADGGFAMGYCARGGTAFGPHTIDASGRVSAAAKSAFATFEWFFGTWPPSMASFFMTILTLLVITLVVAGLVGALAWRAAMREEGPEPGIQ